MDILRIMGKFGSIAALLCILLLLQSCATMNENDCLSADWTSIGNKDGARGLKDSRFESRASACKKYNVVADYSAYIQGYNNGIREFCIPRNGYRIGTNKREYDYVCPNDMQDPFLREYVKGLNYAINEIESDQRELDLDYRDAKVDLKKATTDKNKESIQNKLRRIENNIDGLRDEKVKIRSWINSAIDQF